jgi:acyl-CoA thioesterase-1
MDKPDQIKIIAFGDSITEGTYGGADESRAWPNILQQLLIQDGHNVSVKNLGLPGETATLGRRRFRNAVPHQNPDIILIMYGANDAFVPFGYGEPVVTIPDFKNAISDMVTGAADSGIIPVLMTTTPLFIEDSDGFDQNELLGRYMQKVHDLAQRRSLLLIDHFSKWMENEQTIKNYLPDGVHPNADGNRLIAETIFSQLSKIIRKEFNT